MKLINALIFAAISLITTACQTPHPAMNNNPVSSTPGISIVVQCRNEWNAEAEVMRTILDFASVQNVIISGSHFFSSEVRVYCLVLNEADIQRIRERLQQVNGVMNVMIERV